MSLWYGGCSVSSIAAGRSVNPSIVTRRLAAIFIADVVGVSRHIRQPVEADRQTNRVYASGLEFGADERAQPPQLANDLENLQEGCVTIYGVKVTLLETGTARKTCNP